jgi:hypothetical protein
MFLDSSTRPNFPTSLLYSLLLSSAKAISASATEINVSKLRNILIIIQVKHKYFVMWEFNK